MLKGFVSKGFVLNGVVLMLISPSYHITIQANVWSRSHLPGINVMPHHATAHHTTPHIMPGKQQMMPKITLLHAAIGCATDIVTTGKSSLVT